MAKELLDEYMRGFEERNPNMKVFNAALHADEDTPHLHIDFVPVCYNQKRGLSTRVSMRRALAEQGFTPSNKMQNELVAWEKSEMEYMTALLRSRGIERDVKNNTEKHLPVDEFKEKQAAIDEKNRLVQTLNALKKTPAEEYSAEDTVLIKNTNDFLTEKINRLSEQLAAQRQLNQSPFVEYDIYDPDKLQYVIDGLKKSSIPFVRQLDTIHEFHLHSRDGIQRKMEELESLIQKGEKKNLDVSQEKEDLARVRELMKVYKIVVEGNFIDNLIKAENERKELEANIEAERKRQADIEAKRKAMQQQALQKKEAEKAAAPAPAPKPEQPKTVQQTAQPPKKKMGHRR